MKSCKKVNWKTDIWCYFNKPSATKTVNFPACETLKSQFGSKDFSIGRPRSLRSKCNWALVRFGNVILAQYRISSRPTIEALASCRYRKSRIRSLSSFCKRKSFSIFDISLHALYFQIIFLGGVTKLPVNIIVLHVTTKEEEILVLLLLRPTLNLFLWMMWENYKVRWYSGIVRTS